MTVTRRWSHQAGRSWRKWGDPLYVADHSVRDRVFWLFCLDLGGLLGWYAS